MDAANSTCCEEADTSGGAHEHSGSDGGCTGCFLRQDGSEIAATHFENAFFGGEAFDLRVSETDNDLALEQADGGGNGARAANGGFHETRGFEIARKWEAVGNDSGFQGHDGATAMDGGEGFFAYV
jgi:hypothetical protein